MSARVILGLDPGLALFGYGLIRVEGDRIDHLAHGCISTSSGASLAARLRVLYDRLLDLRSAHPVTDVSLETLYFSRNVSTALAVGQARGVAILATVAGEIRLAEYTPTQVKEAVAGHGSARKPEMQQMVQLMLGLSSPPSPDDAADALGLALCHARRLVLEEAISHASAVAMP